MLRSFAVAVLFLLTSLAGQPSIAQESVGPLQGLQRLLNNAGFPVGTADGVWGGKTRDAVRAFSALYQLPWDTVDKQPSDQDLAALLGQAETVIAAEYALYPTPPLDPARYFAGVSNQWYYNIHNWASEAVEQTDGKAARVPVERYYQPLDGDAQAFEAAGVKVVREQLGIEGALFFEQCDFKNEDPDQGCYVKAFAKAKADGWRKQREALEHISDNPVVRAYVQAVKFWNDRGFQVIVVPSDFFEQGSANLKGEDTSGIDTLLHAVLMTDPGFQAFLPDFTGAVVGELRKAGLTNIAVQALNEPRYCPRGNPTAKGLGRWKAEERKIFDAVRRMAPRVSLISSAICTAGVLHIEADPTLEHLERIVPLHGDLDGVTYAVHIYNPALLFSAGASITEKYKDGLKVRYPYEKVATSLGADEGGKWAIGVYNKMKPDGAFIEKRFANMAAFAGRAGINMMVTEVAIGKPAFGLSREDRFALLGDILRAGEKYGVPVIYGAMFDKYGLSSCAHDVEVPDHRLDPALLGLFAQANAAGNVELASVSPLEETCGVPVMFNTYVQIKQEAGTTLDYLLAVSQPGSTIKNIFNVQATYSARVGNVIGLDLVFHGNELAKGPSKALMECGNVPPIVQWDDNPAFVVLRFVTTGTTLKAKYADCVLQNVPEALANRVRQVANNLPKIAEDMAATGAIDGVGPNMREWLSHLANGTVTVEAVN